MNITDFLLVRIAEDEADARQLAHDLERWRHETARNGPDGTQGSIVASLIPGSAADPDRILADCTAKRRLLELLDNEVIGWDELTVGYSPEDWQAKQAAKAMALPYADRPDYDPAWRP